MMELSSEIFAALQDLENKFEQYHDRMMAIINTEKACLLQLQDEGTSATIKSAITTNDDKNKDRKSGLGISNFGEIVGSDDDFNVGEVEAPSRGPRSEEERTCRFEEESTCDQSGAEDMVQGSEAGGHSKAEASASDDERRNESEAEQSDHSVEEKSNRSDVAPGRSRLSEEAANFRSEGVVSDNEGSEREEEHSERERRVHSGGDASGSDIEREGSDRPDQSDAEVERSVHQDIGDAERFMHQGMNDAERFVHQGMNDAERSDHQKEGGDRRSDRHHSEHSARSRSPEGSENEVAGREARSGSASDNEPVQRKETKKVEESEGSQRGSDNDEKVVHRKRRKQRAQGGKVENLSIITKPNIEQRWIVKATKKRLLCVPGSVSWVMFLVTAVFLGSVDGTGDSVSPFPWRVTLSGAVGTSTGVPQRQDVCGTSACVGAASHLRNCVRPGVVPCGDVGDFSCGDWLGSRSRPPGEGCLLARRSVSEELGCSAHAVVGSLPSRKCKILYQSCMNLTAIGRAGSKPLGTFLGDL